MENASLRELIPNYPAAAPRSLSELVQVEYDELKDLTGDDTQRQMLLGLRKQVIEAIHAFERDPINCPEDLFEQLTSRRIGPLARRWLVVALDTGNCRIAVPRRNGGGLRWLQEPYAKVPDAAQLTAAMRLPRDGKYLLVYGGGPDVLGDGDVVDALVRLTGSAPVADVTFYQLRSDQPPALFSVRAGCGDRGGVRVEFPDPDTTATLQSALRTKE